MTIKRILTASMLAVLCITGQIFAQSATSVGAGSYTTTLPAAAATPPSTVYSTASGPVATHKFWTSKYWTALSGGTNMFPQPLGANATATGMQLGYFGDIFGWDPINNYSDKSANDSAFYQGFNGELTIGNAQVNASAVHVSATTDWTADFNWGPSLTVRMGRGMPFAYVLTDGTPVTVTFAATNTVTIVSGTPGSSNILAVSDYYSSYGNNYTNYYGLFCPAGGVWAQSGKTFTCTTPSGRNYMSVGLLPGLANGNSSTIAQQLSDYSAVAFSFPVNTQVSWNYNESNSTISTTYTVTTKSMDGSSTGFLMALYPHQYDALPGGANTNYSFLTSRGNLLVNKGASFTTTDTFHGVLPFMPPTTNYNMATLKSYVDSAPTASIQGDTYNQGKVLGEVAQVLPLAQLADPAAYTSLDAGLESVMQNWFTASGKSTNVFYYDNTWGSLIGYPAGYGSDTSLNDHHFHYGYFIHAAAINGLFNPGWVSSSNWGGMVGMLQQDIANYDRTNTMFPFMRHFDVYAGHSWAAGSAPFGDGGNEESSSEAVNAWTGMILFGAATGNTELRDAGIWLYTQETKGVAYYWLNEKPSWVKVNATSTFPSWFAPLRIANVFDDKSDTGTWFGGNPDFEHAIEYLPFTGGSLHLGFNPAYVKANYLEDYTENNNTLPNWPDLMEMYEALEDPQTALSQWQAMPASSMFFGESMAHEYAWLMSLQALGQVDVSVTANTPLYAVFNNNGALAHVAFNPGTSSLNVTFSDGATITVPAASMASDSPLVIPFTLGNGNSGSSVPTAPTGVTATAKSATEIDLSWAASTTSGVTYNVYRGTVSGFTPSSANLVANSLSTAGYANTNLTASTTYYYLVEAVNAAGSSAPSSQVSATTNASGSGGSTPGSNTLYLVGGATVSTPSTLSFTAGTSGSDSMPANSPQSPNVPVNPLVYVIKGLNGTYNSSTSTQFNLYVDAGTNAGEAAQVEVIYDLLGDGSQVHTELYYYYATDPVAGFEDYTQSDRGGLASATGSNLGNMTNGKVTIKVWNALPGSNAQPIGLSVGNNTNALSDVVIPFTGVTQGVAIPTAPTGVTATAASANEIDLSWTASTTSGVSYSVYRSTVSGFTPSSSNLVSSLLNTASYADKTLTASTRYYYVVEAVNAAGSSAPSSQVSATTNSATVPVSNILYLVRGATVSTPSSLSFTAGTSGTDSIPANSPQSPNVPSNPLVYVISGLNGTYNSAASTQFNLYLDAGTNVGEAAQVEVIYDLIGDGSKVRTEMYYYFATDPVAGFEDYTQSDRGGLESTTGSNLGNMTNGKVTIKVWNALPGSNAQPISLSVGNNTNALSELVIPFTSVTR